MLNCEKISSTYRLFHAYYYMRDMDDTSLALEGFCLERKDRDHRRGGGVAYAT